MTAFVPSDPFWLRWLDHDRVIALRSRWRARLNRFAAPEVLIATFIVVMWALLATLASGSIVVIGFVIGLGLWVHLSAVESGNHSLLWIATGMVLAFIVVAANTWFDGLEPVSYTVAAVIALSHNELVRLNHARRRSGAVDEAVYVSVAIGLGVVGLISVGAIGLAQQMNQGTDRTWLWMAAAAALITTMAVLLTVLPARNDSPAVRGRWRPGDRIPPQPLGEEDIA